MLEIVLMNVLVQYYLYLCKYLCTNRVFTNNVKLQAVRFEEEEEKDNLIMNVIKESDRTAST